MRLIADWSFNLYFSHHFFIHATGNTQTLAQINHNYVSRCIGSKWFWLQWYLEVFHFKSDIKTMVVRRNTYTRWKFASAATEAHNLRCFDQHQSEIGADTWQGKKYVIAMYKRYGRWQSSIRRRLSSRNWDKYVVPLLWLLALCYEMRHKQTLCGYTQIASHTLWSN